MAVIPSGTSEPFFWAAREAAANDALARLFLSLAARREDRRAQQEFQMGMRNQQQDFTMQRDAAQQQNRIDLYDRYGRGQQPQHNPLGPGANTTATAPAPAPAPVKMIPGSQPTGPATGGFTPGPAGPPQQQMSEAAIPTTAQPVEGTVPPNVNLSGRRRVGDPYTPPVTRSQQPGTQLPRPPGRNTQQAAFVPIRGEILQAWDAAEKKYGLPRGILLTTLGFENSGGRNISQNPRSQGGAAGYFQFTEGLMREYGVPPETRNDPVRMGELAARNFRRNADQLQKLSNIKLGNGVDDIPAYTILHQFGINDGPAIVASMKLNPDIPLVNVMAKVQGRDNARVLVNNGIPSNATVRNMMDGHVRKLRPWTEAAVQMQEGPQQPQQQQQPQVAQQQPQAGGGGAYPPVDPNAPVPRGANYMRGQPDPSSLVSIQTPGGGSVSVHRDAAMPFQGFLRYLADKGAPIRSFGGYSPRNIARTGTRSQHWHGNAIDIEQRGRSVVARAFGMWAQTPEGRQAIRDGQRLFNIVSGGDWSNPDFGHFEWNGQPLRPEVVAAMQQPPQTKEAAQVQVKPQTPMEASAVDPTTAATSTPDEANKPLGATNARGDYARADQQIPTPTARPAEAPQNVPIPQERPTDAPQSDTPVAAANPTVQALMDEANRIKAQKEQQQPRSYMEELVQQGLLQRPPAAAPAEAPAAPAVQQAPQAGGMVNAEGQIDPELANQQPVEAPQPQIMNKVSELWGQTAAKQLIDQVFAKKPQAAPPAPINIPPRRIQTQKMLPSGEFELPPAAPITIPQVQRGGQNTTAVPYPVPGAATTPPPPQVGGGGGAKGIPKRVPDGMGGFKYLPPDEVQMTDEELALPPDMLMELEPVD